MTRLRDIKVDRKSQTGPIAAISDQLEHAITTLALIAATPGGDAIADAMRKAATAALAKIKRD